MHAAAVPRFVPAVRRKLDVAASVADADKVVLLAAFDELSLLALSRAGNNRCVTPEEVLGVAGRKRLRRLNLLIIQVTPRHLPEYVKQAWLAEVKPMISYTRTRPPPSAMDADAQGPVKCTAIASGPFGASLTGLDDSHMSCEETNYGGHGDVLTLGGIGEER